MQVLCNGLVPAVLACTAGVLTGGRDIPLNAAAAPKATAVLGAFIGYMACCCGDTWASELGQLSEEQPRLVTSLRPVRKVRKADV